MDAEKATYPITRMAELLDVSRSGFYDWQRRRCAPPSPARQRRAALTEQIIGFHAASDHVYGSPRILADLRENGQVVSAKTVAKLMRANGIVGISPRRFVPVTTFPGPDPQPIPDLANRRFDRGRLNAVWTSDVTYLATDEGWLYLCAVRDGCSPRLGLGRRRSSTHRPGRNRAATGGQSPRPTPGQGHFPRRPGLPIHLPPTRGSRRGIACPAISGPDRRVLGLWPPNHTGRP